MSSDIFSDISDEEDNAAPQQQEQAPEEELPAVKEEQYYALFEVDTSRDVILFKQIIVPTRAYKKREILTILKNPIIHIFTEDAHNYFVDEIRIPNVSVREITEDDPLFKYILCGDMTLNEMAHSLFNRTNAQEYLSKIIQASIKSKINEKFYYTDKKDYISSIFQTIDIMGISYSILGAISGYQQGKNLVSSMNKQQCITNLGSYFIYTIKSTISAMIKHPYDEETTIDDIDCGFDINMYYILMKNKFRKDITDDMCKSYKKIKFMQTIMDLVWLCGMSFDRSILPTLNKDRNPYKVFSDILQTDDFFVEERVVAEWITNAARVELQNGVDYAVNFMKNYKMKNSDIRNPLYGNVYYDKKQKKYLAPSYYKALTAINLMARNGFYFAAKGFTPTVYKFIRQNSINKIRREYNKPDIDNEAEADGFSTVCYFICVDSSLEVGSDEILKEPYVISVLDEFLKSINQRNYNGIADVPLLPQLQRMFRNYTVVASMTPELEKGSPLMPVFSFVCRVFCPYAACEYPTAAFKSLKLTRNIEGYACSWYTNFIKTLVNIENINKPINVEFESESKMMYIQDTSQQNLMMTIQEENMRKKDDQVVSNTYIQSSIKYFQSTIKKDFDPRTLTKSKEIYLNEEYYSYGPATKVIAMSPVDAFPNTSRQPTEGLRAYFNANYPRSGMQFNQVQPYERELDASLLFDPDEDELPQPPQREEIQNKNQTEPNQNQMQPSFLSDDDFSFSEDNNNDNNNNDDDEPQREENPPKDNDNDPFATIKFIDLSD